MLGHTPVPQELRPLQRGRPELRIGRGRIGSVIEQRLHHFQLTGTGGHVQRRPTI